MFVLKSQCFFQTYLYLNDNDRPLPGSSYTLFKWRTKSFMSQISLLPDSSAIWLCLLAHRRQMSEIRQSINFLPLSSRYQVFSVCITVQSENKPNKSRFVKYWETRAFSWTRAIYAFLTACSTSSLVAKKSQLLLLVARTRSDFLLVNKLNLPSW